MSGLGCARCGRCCDPVHLAPDQRDLIDRWRQHVADGGEKPEQGYDIRFILDHWTELEHRDSGTTYRCDRFDPETRTCTAHDDRPPVCRDYPVLRPARRHPQPSSPATTARRARTGGTCPPTSGPRACGR